MVAILDARGLVSLNNKNNDPIILIANNNSKVQLYKKTSKIAQ